VVRNSSLTIRRFSLGGIASALVATLLMQPALAEGVSQLRAVKGQLSLPPQQAGPQEEKLYIVQLESVPAMTFHQRREQRRTGGARGMSRRFNAYDTDIQIYSERLNNEQDELLNLLGLKNKPVYRYRNTFNGFAVKMTEAQANKLRTRRGVVAVREDRMRYVSTIDSPDFLGLNDSGTGLRKALNLDGEGVIVGVIDSGIATNHPSFDDSRSGKPDGLCGSSWAEESLIGRWLCGRILDRYEDPVYSKPPDHWQGVCETGTDFEEKHCNNKLIGARFYREGFEASFATDANEFISPKDADGHGTHIASIAAGNEVPASIGGTTLGKVSGMAPRARVAVYKACWLRPGGVRASCSIADLTSAIDDAVADGVDIINYSVGTLDPGINDTDDIALLTAAENGVFTAAASGNEGPYPGSINSPGSAPWVTTVGASSRAGREYDTAILVNTPASLAGEYLMLEASFTPTLKDNGPVIADLVLADDGSTVTPDGELGTTYDGCSPLINATDMSDKIALMVRGGCDFDLKIANAGDAGALAAIIYNDEAVPFVMDGSRDAVTIPAVMVGQANGTLLRDELLDDKQVEATLDSGIYVPFDVDGNDMGSFSSRGPNMEVQDILKPDVTAPGVNILAGQTPDVANGLRGEEFQYLSGTSMAVPHVSGIAALIKQEHPDFTPAEIKSALMTTARQNIEKEDSETDADPFDMGAGHIEPNLSANPGLVYPADINDYQAFMCGTEEPLLDASGCTELTDAGYQTEPYNLNLPSVALSKLVASTEVARRVRSVGTDSAYNLSVDAPDGINVSIEPNVLVPDGDGEATFTITFENQTDVQNSWLFGSYTWSANGVEVRSPFAVRPVKLGATENAAGSGIAGSTPINVQFGFNGDYLPQLHGLNKPCLLPDTNTQDEINFGQACSNNGTRSFVANDPFDFYELTDQPPAWVKRYFVELPADQLAWRVRLLSEFTDGDDDLDVYVYYCPVFVNDTCLDNPNVEGDEPQLLGNNSDPGSDLTIDLPAIAGIWIIDVHGFNTDDVAGGPGSSFRLHTWSLGNNDDAGNLDLPDKPANVSTGLSQDITVEWSGLEEDIYFGAISHSDDAAVVGKYGLTLIEVDARDTP